VVTSFSFFLVTMDVRVSLRAPRLIPRASLPALFFFLLLLYLARLEIMLCSLLWSWNYVVLCYVWYGQSLELQWKCIRCLDIYAEERKVAYRNIRIWIKHLESFFWGNNYLEKSISWGKSALQQPWENGMWHTTHHQPIALRVIVNRFLPFTLIFYEIF
jgi:hypothetical protein